ncbi:MAG: DUF1828 domain-containing protein [Thermoguttaceae bacterium]|nr:DUF1828 domain-containing protein [Thermoguttaceae bacterium]
MLGFTIFLIMVSDLTCLCDSITALLTTKHEEAVNKIGTDALFELVRYKVHMLLSILESRYYDQHGKRPSNVWDTPYEIASKTGAMLYVEYAEWLKRTLKRVSVDCDGYVRICFPFETRFGTPLEIYIKEEEQGMFFLTDKGVTLSNIESATFLEPEQIQKNTITILDRYGLYMKNRAVCCRSNLIDFPASLQKMSQALIVLDALNDFDLAES